jgi:RNA polymerase sigma-70 factor (ECF subfamily)
VERPKSFDDELMKALPRARYYAYSLTKSKDAAEELLNETVIKVLRNWEGFQAGTNFTYWMNTTLFHTYLNQKRSWHNRNMIQFRQTFKGTDELHPSQVVIPNYDTREDLHRVLFALPTLSDPHRRAIEMKALGYEYSEIAEIEEIAEGTVKSRLNRGRKLLVEKTGVTFDG